MKINLATHPKQNAVFIIGLHKENYIYPTLPEDISEFVYNYADNNPESRKSGQQKVFNIKSEDKLQRFMIFGLDSKDLPSETTFRDIAGNLVRFLQSEKETDVSIYLPQTDPLMISGFVQGLILGSYTFELLKSKPQTNTLQEVNIILPEISSEAHQALKSALTIAANVNLARDLTNLPGNILTPKELAEKSERLAERLNITCKTLKRKELERNGMRLMLAVSQGSENAPYLITMQYRGNRSSKELVALVGKGVTFDSGGISIKPSAGMEEMKDDMAGAAAVLAAIKTIAELKLPCNVVAVMPCVENMPSGTAIRPGDIVEGMNGKSVEIVNTDAEGRLILADAVHYAERELGATKVIDIATLTGAASVALGSLYAATVTNSTKLHTQLAVASEKSGEKIWQLPSDDEYKELFKSDHADMKNSGGRDAGTIVGGLFIGEFITKDWVHIDIGATVSCKASKGHLAKGATGYGVRLLVQLCREVFSC